MPLKKSSGNMYLWVSHTHSHLEGKCPHACSYCYVQAMSKRFPSMEKRYGGPPALNLPELHVSYGEGKTIFIEHLNDLFAEGVPSEYIIKILDHCRQHPKNTYVLQTKNPKRLLHFIGRLPESVVIGTTLESNRHITANMGTAPAPVERAKAMRCLPLGLETFITIEPILDFDLEEFLPMIVNCNPGFVNIGADSKGTGLVEPSGAKVLALIQALKNSGVEIRQKTNLERLLKS